MSYLKGVWRCMLAVFLVHLGSPAGANGAGIDSIVRGAEFGDPGNQPDLMDRSFLLIPVDCFGETTGVCCWIVV